MSSSSDDIDMDASKDPIIFSKAVEPDTSLNVLGQEFHVHSYLLKHHSQFFRNFMDSPEKKVTSTNPKFKYEWSSRVEENGDSWALVCGPTEATKKLRDAQNFTEIEAITLILKAMYGQAFEIDHVDCLEAAVKHADYYRALPILSIGLSAAFITSPELTGNIADVAEYAASWGLKLRNATLFKEAMIYLMTPWDSPRYKKLQDQYLKAIAARYHHTLCMRVLSVRSSWIELITNLEAEAINQGTLQQTTASQVRIEKLRVGERHIRNRVHGISGKVVLPTFFRRLLTFLEENWTADLGSREAYEQGIELAIDLESILVNCTVFRKDAVAGEDAFYRDFLSLAIEDEELPWDVNEREW